MKPYPALSPERFAQLRESFHRLLACADSEREAYLHSVTAEDAELAQALRGLLATLDEADLAPTAPLDARGQQFGPYRIVEQIGRGGMGVVYRAERIDGAFEQQVAIKLLPAGTRSRELVQRFLRERRILARLAHSNIARLLDGGVSADGRPWLAMEYVLGVPLLDHCAGVPLRRRVELLIELCGAVAYAHSQLVVHRDIKPSNVLVDRDGRPRLLDFGIARLEDDSELSATQTGMRALTPRFAAPEQLRGERASTAADVYALGGLLQHCLQDGAPARRAELLRIAAKASAAEPAQRYASAAALADDLRDWLQQRPLRSGIGSPRARLRSLWVHQRAALVGTGAVALALLLGGLVALHQARVAAAQAQVADGNLQALLDVLAAASPEIYAGRDPKASEFLVEAAHRLEAEHQANPWLIWRSHSQIGVGLINLNAFERAEALLQTSLRALQLSPQRTTADEIDTLRYLVLAQRGRADIDAIRATGEAIAELARRPDAPPGSAISALASAANSLSRLGEFDAGRPWLALADQLAQTPALPTQSLENYWRQRGWFALRARELDAAEHALQRSLAEIDAHPGSYPALRRAEAEMLLAEVALQRDDGASAEPHLRQAQAAFEAEYAPEHPERALYALMRARAQLLQARPPDPVALQAAVDTLRADAASSAEPSADADLELAVATLAAARALQGECAAVPETTGSAVPSRVHALQAMLDRASRACR
ncbi:MAG: serine/threonine-protein kinase [Lysobacterales bacterium]